MDVKMCNFNIRECTLEDLEHVVKLQHQWVKENITYGLVEVDKEYLEAKLGKYFYVAELKTEIKGFIYGEIHTSNNMAVMDDGQPYIEVEDLYVSHDNRGTGLGSILLDKLLAVAKENGAHRSLIYSSTKDMDSIINFYKKHDYKTWYIKMFK